MPTIRVRMSNLKWYEVDGQMVGETIALTPALNDKLEYTNLWNVTHTPTGGTFTDNERKATAVAIANALVELGFDGVMETDVDLAVRKMKAKGDITGLMSRMRKRSPEEVARTARAAKKARPERAAASVKPARRPKPAKTSKPKTKAKAPPDLLALARAARRGTL